MGASIAVRATGRVEIAAVGEGNNRTGHLLHVSVDPVTGAPSIIDVTTEVSNIPGSGLPYTVAP